eukprot:961221_1
MDEDEPFSVHQDTKNLIFGYCRAASNDLAQTIIHLVLFYFNDNYKFDTTSQYYGRGLYFYDNNQTVQTKFKYDPHNTARRTSVCIYGEPISDKQCNKFEIYIQWKTCQFSSVFFMGYITSSIQQSIQRWNNALGQFANKEYSVGIEVNSWRHNFIYYDKNNEEKELKYESKLSFRENDMFKMEFNFIDDTLTIYHNNNKAD